MFIIKQSIKNKIAIQLDIQMLKKRKTRIKRPSNIHQTYGTNKKEYVEGILS